MPNLSLPLIASVVPSQPGCLLLEGYLLQRTVINEPTTDVGNKVTFNQPLTQIEFITGGFFPDFSPQLGITGPNGYSATLPLSIMTDRLVSYRNTLPTDFPYVGTYTLQLTCVSQGQTYLSTIVSVVITTLH